MNLEKLALRDGQFFRCVVESPRGSQVKLKYDPELEAFSVSRPLIEGLTYPFDWGFLPSTEGADGDPLDVMLLHDTPTFPGLVVPAKLVAVLEAKSDGQRNDRFFAVPAMTVQRRAMQLTERLRAELEHFFQAAVALEDKHLRIMGWHGARRARELVRKRSKKASVH